MPKTIILGSGMGGFGAAYRFHAEGVTPVMYDKKAYHGRSHGVFPGQRFHLG